MAVLNNLAYGDSSTIQFIDDGTIVIRPKHNATVAGLELVGFMQLDQQAAPAVSPSGSVRLYFDTAQQTVLQSIGGAAYTAFGVSTQISQGGGSVAVDASGNITVTPSATGSSTINGGAGGSIVASAAGALTLTTLSGQLLSLVGSGSGGITIAAPSGQILIRNTLSNGTIVIQSNVASGGITLNATTGAGNTGIALNGPSSSAITINASGAITLTAASGQFVSGSVAPTPSAGMTWIAPLGYGPVSAAAPTGNNSVVLYLIYIPFNLTVNTMAISVNTLLAAAHLGIGFYTYAASQASATLLGGATFSLAATGRITASPTPFTLTPGWYWYAWTKDTATATEAVTSAPTPSVGGDLLAGGASGARPFASATSTSSAGVLPGTTGTINAFAGSQISAIPACAINQ